MISDSGRGFRKVVPSLAPLDLLEKDTIIRLFECGTILISAGGGGVGRQNLFDCLVGAISAALGRTRLLRRVFGRENGIGNDVRGSASLRTP